MVRLGQIAELHAEHRLDGAVTAPGFPRLFAAEGFQLPQRVGQVHGITKISLNENGRARI